MAEIIQASTQYGDLKGTIAIDGWDGMTVLSAGGKCPAGYWPVGVQLYGEPVSRNAGIEFDAYVFAVDMNILEPGEPTSMVRRYAAENGRVPVFRFNVAISAERLLKRCKRIDLVLHDKALRGASMFLVGEG